MISNRQLTLFIQQSNLIEGIERKPTPVEFEAHRRFLAVDQVIIPDLEEFVRVVQPGAILRDRPGLNVRVGNHVPPLGGPAIPLRLQELLDQVNERAVDAWRAHCQYETIHPFTDGNGRSGRVLWLWQQRGRTLPPGLFLHKFYYQTLDNFRA